MKISFNICFWSFNDVENRKKNTYFTWKRLNIFIEYLNQNFPEIESKCFLFDLSTDKIIEEAIHIPQIENTYERSKKLNLCLEWNLLNFQPDIVCFLDSDVFFLEDQFDKLSNYIQNFDRRTFITSNVFDLMNNDSIDFENLSFSSEPSVGIREIPGLGAFFMIDFRTIINICGFDERFKVWGGEDDDLRLRLERIRFYRINLQCTLYHLYHNTLINHANVENAEQKKKQCEAFEDKTIFRTTLLSQYSNYSII